MSAIYRVNQKFGKNYVIDILRGSKEQKILSNGHDSLSVYAIGDELSKNQWFSIFDRLLELEAIAIGEFQVLELTDTGKTILKGNKDVSIREDRLEIKTKISKTREEIIDFDIYIFEDLRKIRATLAKENSLPAYIIFPDKTLKDMSNKLPKTKNDMLEINGVGDKKFSQYGKIFLDYFLNEF